jgi:hypothetical protein
MNFLLLSCNLYVDLLYIHYTYEFFLFLIKFFYYLSKKKKKKKKKKGKNFKKKILFN